MTGNLQTKIGGKTDVGFGREAVQDVGFQREPEIKAEVDSLRGRDATR